MSKDRGSLTDIDQSESIFTAITVLMCIVSLINSVQGMDMRIEKSGYSISQILTMMERKELVVNKDYQRGSGFWPKNAMVYLIDTILNDFQVPKLYFSETVNLETRRTKMEIIDGQQRISVIREFAANGFRLTSYSEKFQGLNFNDLEDNDKRQFLGYPLQVDLVLQATSSEVLEMFRRMNSHTTPLNKQEQRHAEFNGEFKWFINRLADEYSNFFTTFKILTNKQVIRMGDGELLTELVMLPIEGIVNRGQPRMKRYYKDYNSEFLMADQIEDKLTKTFEFIQTNLSELVGTLIFKSYAFYSLVAALMYNKRLINTLDDDRLPDASGEFVSDLRDAITGLQQLAHAHETKDIDGNFREYVRASVETTHTYSSRMARTAWMVRALNGEITRG